jgi:multidrug efflux pump subunit AcrA (membrane-fusion protein)
MKAPLAFAFVLAFGCGEHATPSRGDGAPRTATVERGAVTERLLLTGTLRAAGAIDLAVPRTDSWQLGIRWLAEDGATVKAGDRIVEFDNSAFTEKLEEKRLAALDAKMTFQSFQDVTAVDLADKAASVEQAEIALRKAKVLADVPADLLPARTAQERQLERTRADVALAKAKRELASARDAAALEGRVKQLALDKAVRAVATDEQTIAQLVLVAPRDGVVVINDHPWEGRRFHVGDNVQPGMMIASLPDFDKPMEVLAELSDVDDGRVAVGEAARCTLDARAGEPIDCKVADVAPVARPHKHQSLRRSFDVRLALAASDPARMRPGMSVKVELARAPIAGTIVARGAVFRDDKAARVELAGGGAREVTLGACDAQACVVEHGLAAGDVVIVEPAR